MMLAASMMLMNYYAAVGMPRVVVVAPLLGLLINIALNVALLPVMGIVGASIASSVAYGAMLAVAIVHAARNRGVDADRGGAAT